MCQRYTCEKRKRFIRSHVRRSCFQNSTCLA